METIDGQSTAGQLVVSREDRQRTRNRLAQRRHRERKRCADSREHGHGHGHRRRNTCSHTTDATDHAISSDPPLPPLPPLPTPPPQHAVPTLPVPHFGLMPSPSSWERRTDLHIPGVHDHGLTDLSPLQQTEGQPSLTPRFPLEHIGRHAGARKAQPVGAEMMNLLEGDYWLTQTYSPAHEIWDPIGGKPMSTIQSSPAAVHLLSPNETARSRSSSDAASSSCSDTSRQAAVQYTPLSLQGNHKTGHERRKTREKHEDFAIQRPASANLNAFSTTTPVGAASNAPKRESTTRAGSSYDDADDDCLEARLERVLHIVEDSGFDSIDSMTSAYYTSELLEDSFLRPMQATSRTRRLRSLLSDLQGSYKSWTGREMSAYAEEVVRSAEGICSDELAGLYGSREGTAAATSSPVRRRTDSSLREPSLEDQQNASLQSKRSEVARRIREVLSSPDISEFMQRDQAALQSSVPETWSMMIEMARRAGLQPHERVMVACINVYLLTDHHSS